MKRNILLCAVLAACIAAAFTMGGCEFHFRLEEKTRAGSGPSGLLSEEDAVFSVGGREITLFRTTLGEARETFPEGELYAPEGLAIPEEGLLLNAYLDTDDARMQFANLGGDWVSCGILGLGDIGTARGIENLISTEDDVLRAYGEGILWGEDVEGAARTRTYHLYLPTMPFAFMDFWVREDGVINTINIGLVENEFGGC